MNSFWSQSLRDTVLNPILVKDYDSDLKTRRYAYRVVLEKSRLLIYLTSFSLTGGSIHLLPPRGRRAALAPRRAADKRDVCAGRGGATSAVTVLYLRSSVSLQLVYFERTPGAGAHQICPKIPSPPPPSGERCSLLRDRRSQE
mgnify:CR=1 FL=1